MEDDISGGKDQRDSRVQIGQKGLIGVIQIKGKGNSESCCVTRV